MSALSPSGCHSKRPSRMVHCSLSMRTSCRMKSARSCSLRKSSALHRPGLAQRYGEYRLRSAASTCSRKCVVYINPDYYVSMGAAMLCALAD